MWKIHKIALNDDRIYTYLLGSAPLKNALTVSVNAAATGSVSWAPMVRGLGPLEQPDSNTKAYRHTETEGNSLNAHKGREQTKKYCFQTPKLYTRPNNTVWMKWALTHAVQTTVMKLNVTTNINVGIISWKWPFISLCLLTAYITTATYNTSLKCRNTKL